MQVVMPNATLRTLAAEAIAYGKNIVFSGPVYESMKVEGDKIRFQRAISLEVHGRVGAPASELPDIVEIARRDRRHRRLGRGGVIAGARGFIARRVDIDAARQHRIRRGVDVPQDARRRAGRHS